MGANFSSKFSPWMANGTISPRYIYWQVKEWENKFNHGKLNASTEKFVFELFWRDFYKYWAMENGTSIF